MAGMDKRIEAIVAKLAMTIVDAFGSVVRTIAEMEASTADRTMRSMYRRAMIQDLARQLWRDAGRELVASSLAGAGIAHDSVDELFPAFWIGVRLAIDDKLGAEPAVLSPRSWRRVGGAGRDVPGLPPPPAGEPASYVLAVDRVAGELRYVCGADVRDFGVAWAQVGDRWEARNRIPLALPDRPGQAFTGFFDESRGGIACWSLVGGRAFGVLVDGDGASHIVHDGDVPLHAGPGPDEFGVAFAHDPVRAVTVCHRGDAIHELDRAGRWRVVAEVPEALRPGRSFAGSAAGVFDVARARVLFHWIDWATTEYRSAWWDGSRLVTGDLDGLPERAVIRHGGCFGADGRGLFWVGGGVAPYRLTDRWTPVADAVDGEAPGRISDARASGDVGGTAVVVGPGRYTVAGQPRRLHVFYAHRDGRWIRTGNPRVGTGTARAPRQLAVTDAGLWAVAIDWTTRHRPRGGDWSQVAGPAGARAPLAALIGDGEALWGVAGDGSVWLWRDGGWCERGPASPAFGGETPLVGADLRGRLVAWGADPTTFGVDQTLVFEDGAWHALAAGVPAGGRRSADVGHVLYADGRLGGLALFGAGSLSVLDGGAWRRLRGDDRMAPVHHTQRLVAHDRRTGQTLAVDLVERRVVRLDPAGDAVVADLEQAGPDVDLISPDPAARPLAADWAYDPVERELILFVDDELDEHYLLALGPVFDHAAAAAPRGSRAAEADRPAGDAPAAVASAGPGDRADQRRPRPADEPPALVAPPSWQRFGPAPPPVAVAAPPGRSRRDYALAFDSTAGQLTYVRHRGTDWGETWRWDGTRWQCAHPHGVRLPGGPGRFRPVDDPGRGGIVCWTTGGDEPQTAVGVLIADRVAIGETRGEAPTLSREERRRRHHAMLFARDPRREVTVAFTSRGLWELDARGTWSRRWTWPDDNPLARPWGRADLADATWDAVHGRVVAWFPDADHERVHVVALAEDGPVELDASALPADLCARGSAPIIGGAGPLGVLLHAGPAGGTFLLGRDGWSAAPPDPAAPPRARYCQLAYDPDRSTLMFGPGEYVGADHACHRQHVFHVRIDGAWSHHGVLQPDRDHPFHIEAWAASDDRTVGLDRQGRLFAWTERDGWTAIAEPAWIGPGEVIAAGQRDRDGRLLAVTHTGGVHRLDGAAWTAREVDRTAYGERAADCNAYDAAGDRWLIHDPSRHGGPRVTLLLDGPAWAALDAEPAGAADVASLSRPAAHEIGLVHDTCWDRFVRTEPSGIAVLDRGAWRDLPASLDAAGLAGLSLRPLHDPTTGETLLIDFAGCGLYRLDLDRITFVTRYRLPDGFVDPDPTSNLPTFPYTPRCPYDPDRRALLVFDPDDHHGNFRLDLGPVFDAARALGSRRPLPPDLAGQAGAPAT